ncbi:hypothetical protein PROFUN_09314 [Planoprotostelium fungivorum]|uniref:Uncharacterized protein n=1 Tax=Planoprotostelium fungivorum TaxID=1890364 RepID=A0A2P6NHA0_9EUKA|nr:hypothetical protein PROFUN_09314 [Planoprotostelium fungivorum]
MYKKETAMVVSDRIRVLECDCIGDCEHEWQSLEKQMAFAMTSFCSAHRGARTPDHTVKSRALYRLS